GRQPARAGLHQDQRGRAAARPGLSHRGQRRRRVGRDLDRPGDVVADDLIVPITPRGQAVEQARTFLKDLLRDGPRSSDEAYRQAREAGLSRRTLERAKAELGIRSEIQPTTGQGKQWLWHLRPAAAEDTLDYAERRKRELAEAQKESDAIMARLRERYRNSKSSQEPVV